MKLHIYNPEHDIALAFNRPHLTVPHAAQELRMNLGWLPALWAEEGDVVIVDDVPYAVKASKRSGINQADVLFLSKDEICGMPFDEVLPWGWDITQKTQLEDAGVDVGLLPSEGALIDIRHLSNRRQTTHALQMLRLGIEELTCGKSIYVTTTEAGRKIIDTWKNVVIKAPWSSSGRGIRYVDHNLNDGIRGWIHRVTERQGGVMVEPYYNKVKDFAMEFMAHHDGPVTFSGLSLFHTVNGAYAGNILATENEKMEMLAHFVSESLINAIIQRAISYFTHLFQHIYVGPFGIDMMIVARDDGQGFLLHPCVEINVRRTMGHVALALSSEEQMLKKVMRIEHNVNYQLKINQLENNFVQII